MAVSPAPGILGVRAFTKLLRQRLEESFPAVWVRGEISSLKPHPSGHTYLTLREGNEAQLKCVLFRMEASRLRFQPRDGIEVEVFGRITVYGARGDYQLVIQDMRPAGLGALLLAYEELKRRLQAEGLFDAARKRPLPRFPRRIGLVTSPVGAAVRDMVKVLQTRWPSIGIVLAPVKVQGPGAAEEIVAAIGRFNRYAKVDLLIVGRGGGSMEDLWAFNEEIVVRAIAGSRLPVICAVGHEVDMTLADNAADVRAATPSNAAELAVRDRREMSHRLAAVGARLGRAVRHRIDDRRRRLERAVDKYGFRRLRDALGPPRQRLDDLLERLGGRVRALAQGARARLAAARSRYGLREFPRQLAILERSIDEQARRMTGAMVSGLHARRGRNTACADRLRALSPRLILTRGYCLVRGTDGRLLRAATELAIGDRIMVEFARGEAGARVEDVRTGEEHGG